MEIITKKTIIDFYTKHAEAEIPLEDWYDKVVIAEWPYCADIKRDFNSVNVVGSDRFVFNIRGSHFRLVAHILFIPKIICVRFLGTHRGCGKIESINKM